MCEITSMGEISAARTTTPDGVEVLEAVAGADLRRDLTTSLTPRLRDLCFAAREGGREVSCWGLVWV